MVSIQARIEGIIDVGILVLSHCENPAETDMLSFLTKALKKQIIAIIPYSAFLGAYHIMTNYLKTDRVETANRLITTAMISRDIFHQTINSEHIKYALENAAQLRIDSWDGYLLSLMNQFQTNIIYSIDKKLEKICNVINPISDKIMEKYYEWLAQRLKKRK